MKTENEYVNHLADIGKTSGETNFELLVQDSKEGLEAKEAEINSFIETNTDFDNYSPEEKEKLFESVIDLWNEYKDLVKNAKCHFKTNGIEIKTITKKMYNNVDYTTETIFYGMHLKKYFLDLLPVLKSDFDQADLTITFSQSIALYHVLSTLTVKGLNKENYAFANILYKLSENSKLYQHFDAISLRLNQAIGKWNLGLSKNDFKQLDEAIKTQVIS